MKTVSLKANNFKRWKMAKLLFSIMKKISARVYIRSSILQHKEMFLFWHLKLHSTKDNLMETVVADGFHTREEITGPVVDGKP